MTEALVGIIVGVAVALAAQLISYLFDRGKVEQERRRRKEAVLTLLWHEVEHHRRGYERLMSWAQESVNKGGPAHTGYGYERVRTDVYEKVFLDSWYLLPDEVVEPVMEYYRAIDTINALSGSGDLHRFRRKLGDSFVDLSAAGHFATRAHPQ